MKKLILSICLAFLLLLPAHIFAFQVNLNPTGGITSLNNAPIGAVTPSTGVFTKLTVIPSATETIAIDVQGDTNDYTGSGIAMAFKLARDINRGTGTVLNAAGWQSYLNQKHTDANLTGDHEVYGAISRVDNQGNITNSTANDYQYWSSGAHNTAKIDPGAVFDTDLAGVLEIAVTGTYGYAFADGGYTINNTGTGSPANTVTASGFRAFVENQPTLGAGAAVTSINAGYYVESVLGNTAGTSIGAGLYIPAASVTGSDTNYAIYSLETDPSYFAGAVSVAAFTATGTLTFGTDTLTSAELLDTLSNETGTGVAVFGTSPTVTTPTLVTPTQNILRKSILTSAPTDPILLDEFTVDGATYDPSGGGLTVAHKVVLTRNTTELMPNQVDRDMSGANAWTDGTTTYAMGSYDEETSGKLTITADGVGDFVTLIEASAPTTIGKRYRFVYTLASIASTWTVMDEDAGQTIGTISANATAGYIDFTATTDGGIRLVAVAADSSGVFDDFSLNLLPYILLLDENGTQYANGISSRTPVTDAAADFAAEFTGADLYGGTFICDVTGTIQLPLMVVGMNFTIITLGAIAVVIDTHDDDGYLMDGTTGTEGKHLTNLSTAGDIAVIQYYTAADWLITTNGWTPE